MTAQGGQPPLPGKILSAVFLNGGAVSGYVFDGQETARQFVVELLIEGWPAQIARADLYDHRLAKLGVADRCHGFVFNLPIDAMDPGASIEVSLANGGAVVGDPSIWQGPGPASEQDGSPGHIVWRGGLRFGGWMAQTQAGAAAVRVLIEEDVVMETSSSGWTIIPHSQGERSVPSLDFHLPIRFADGRVRCLDVINAAGETLPGSPIAFVAFDDGLQRFLGTHSSTAPESLRGRLFDEILPQSMPFGWIEEWMGRFPPRRQEGDVGAVAVVLVGEAEFAASLDSLAASDTDWTAGVLSAATRDGRFAPDQLLDFVADGAGACDTVVFALGGTVFEPLALHALAAALSARPAMSLAYADVLLRGPDGEIHPLAHPAFDRERLLEQGYGASLFAMRRTALVTALEQGADSLFRLFNASLDGLAERPALLHVPGFLATCPSFATAATQALADATSAHLHTFGMMAEVAPAPQTLCPAVRVRRLSRGVAVTAVVATSNHGARLRACLDALLAQQTRHRLSIVVVDDASSDPELLDCLAALDPRVATVLRQNGPRSTAAAFNRGAGHEDASAFVLFLDSSIALHEPGWLDEVMSRMGDPDVAAAGSCLVWPDGTIRHGGGVLGPKFGVATACADLQPSNHGFADMLAVAREVSALPHAALLTRRTDFAEVGGFDAIAFPRRFAVADYGLKQRRRGRRLVLTPHVRAVWSGPDTTAPDSIERAPALDRELTRLRNRWRDALMSDPFYNPLLALDHDVFSALAWPPRETSAR